MGLSLDICAAKERRNGDYMKAFKRHIFLVINITYLIITGAVSIYAYFHLPDKVATQIGLTGEMKNRVPTPIYLIIACAIILLLSVLSMTKEKEQKIKYFIALTVCVIAHTAMIIAQL